MLNLTELDLTGNQLESLFGDYSLIKDKIRFYLPSLDSIWLNGNKFNCAYLANIGYTMQTKWIKLMVDEDLASVRKMSNYCRVACFEEDYEDS